MKRRQHIDDKDFLSTAHFDKSVAQLERSIRVQGVLLEISRVSHDTYDLQDLLESIQITLDSILDTSNFYVALYDKQNDSYVFPYCVDEYDVGHIPSERINRSLTDYVRRSEEPLLADEAAHRQLIEKGEAELIGEPSKIWLGVPLKTKDGVIGVVAIQDYNDPLAFSPADLEVMTFASYHIALAIRRKQTEKELRDSQRRLSTHLGNTPIAAIEWSLDFEVIEWNAAAEKIFGYSKEEALGRHAAGLIVPESAREHVDGIWNDLLENSGGIHSTNENLTKDGRTIVCEWNNTPLTDESGRVNGVASLVQDVTHRLEAVAAIRQSEEKYRTLIESNPYGFEVIDVDGIILYSNPAYRKMVGYSEEELLGKSTLDLLDTDKARDSLRAYLAMLVKDQPEPTTFEQKNRTKDGRIIDQIVDWNYRRDSEGRVIGFASVITDITDRKIADAALRESESRFRHLAEASLEGVCITEARVIVEANKQLAEMFGYTLEELVGTSVTQLVAPESQAIVEGHMSNDHQEAYEHEALKKDGTTILVEARGMKTLYKGKQVRVTAIRDITETKRLQELESRAEKLEMAGIIAGQVAHDFNNLLSPILAYPMYIKEELPNDHDAHAYLDAIQNAAGRIAEINQDLLTMGRRAHYNQEALDLNQVVEQIVTEMESRSTTVSVETDLCEDLAPIKGGAAQLHRVLTNLIVNAKDAMDDVGVVSIRTENYYADNTTVVYGAVPKGEYVKLTVSDTGCGIPANVIPKILDPFFSTKTTDKKRGSGLGMSVVDAVIKDHNGYMDLSTKVGEGTSFYVYFPVTTESVQPEVSNEACGGSDTILVVDDDDVQRAVATQLLTKLGYEVNSVESGEKAVEFLRENPRDLVILDMIMPGGSDGAETYRQIIGVSPYQKAIILSGYSASDRVLDVQRMGAGAFVKKPVTRKVLAEAVRKELDRETSPAA